MAKKEINKLTQIIQDTLQQKHIDIDKIVIFGSYAKGNINVHSDIDMIVVSKKFRNKNLFQRIKLIGNLHRELVNRINKPFDIMYYSDDEWRKGNSLVINAAKEDGMIIYSN
ncbi:MAG: nucleotidyltransferase domain-containing protein [bacterium]